MGLLQRIKNAVFVRKIYYWLISVIAGVNHRHEKRRKRNDQLIRVVFICQYVPSWNKISPTYHRLEEDDRFAVSILCVPESISSKENKTYLYFLSHGYKGVLNAWNNGRWISLKEFDADYFFFYRPYDNYLPWPYKSFIACRYGKICMIPYGTSMSRDLMESAFKYPFMSNVAILFADSMAEVEYNSAHNKRFSDQRFLYCGIPALESVLLEKNSSAPSWEWSRNSFRIMWTPRWSLNQKGGGSNYFKYYHRFLDYSQSHPDEDIMIRPHPLMFKSFVEQGVLTEDQVYDIKCEIESQKNVSLDQEQEYASSFWNTSVLITDYSSIIPEFFITKKPIVFCNSEGINWNLIPPFDEMLNSCYVVNTFEEIEKCLTELKQGIDPLKENRSAFLSRIYDSNLVPSEFVLNTLVDLAADPENNS